MNPVRAIMNMHSLSEIMKEHLLMQITKINREL